MLGGALPGAPAEGDGSAGSTSFTESGGLNGITKPCRMFPVARIKNRDPSSMVRIQSLTISAWRASCDHRSASGSVVRKNRMKKLGLSGKVAMTEAEPESMATWLLK